MIVREITVAKEVRVEVTLGGVLLPKKGMNLPDTRISLPSLTEKDLADLEFIMKHQVEWIALSFVRNPADITGLKEKVKKPVIRPKSLPRLKCRRRSLTCVISLWKVTGL